MNAAKVDNSRAEAGVIYLVDENGTRYAEVRTSRGEKPATRVRRKKDHEEFEVVGVDVGPRLIRISEEGDPERLRSRWYPIDLFDVIGQNRPVDPLKAAKQAASLRAQLEELEKIAAQAEPAPPAPPTVPETPKGKKP